MVKWAEFRFPPMSKPCKLCKEVKPNTLFAKHKGSSDGHRAVCKDCRNKEQRDTYVRKPKRKQKTKKELLHNRREYNKTYKERNKDYRLWKQYGITLEDYKNLSKQQEQKCACCFKEVEILYVDHCHTTGEIRGLLCQQCNAGIGLLGDTLQSVQKALQYLSKEKYV